MQREPIGDLCVGRWYSILTSLGVPEQFLINKHGPCVLCGGKDRFRWDNKGGKGSWFCSHCGSGDGFSLLQKLNGWSFPQVAREVERVLGMSKPDTRLQLVRDERSEEEIKASIHKLLTEAKFVVEGDPVWRYLNSRTGITKVPRDLRYHPAHWHKEEKKQFPAMLAVMRYPDKRGASVHRTYLDGMGSKAAVLPVKKMWPGLALATSCVRLSDVEPKIGIAEGIETALAASVVFGFPVWAATSAPVLEKWEPPEGIREIVICGDNDTSYAGQAAAYSLAKRLRTKGYPVTVEIPDPEDADWADVLKTGNQG